MNTEAPETLPEISDEQQRLNILDREQIEKFDKEQEILNECRAFWAKHKDIIMRFSYSFGGWRRKIEFTAGGLDENNHKAIAKAWGADGWKRVRSTYACGSIDWVKEVDGIEVRIENAETAPALKEEVRLA